MKQKTLEAGNAIIDDLNDADKKQAKKQVWQ